jgi:hypothetical protein
MVWLLLKNRDSHLHVCVYMYINNVANLKHLICREVKVLFNDVVSSHN